MARDGIAYCRRAGELRSAVAPHMTILSLGALQLCSKMLTLRKTHCLRIFVKHDRKTDHSKVVKCEAVEISKLLDVYRKHLPVLPVESYNGTANQRSMKELLQGPLEQLGSSAERRESVYLPCLLVELSIDGMKQFLFPNAVLKSEVKKYQRLDLSAKRHQELLDAELQRIAPIAGSPVGGTGDGL